MSPGPNTLVRLGVDLPLAQSEQEINTWISTCLRRPRWLGLGHLSLGDVSGISQKEKPTAWALPRRHLLPLGMLLSVSKGMHRNLDGFNFLAGPTLQDQHLLREWEALTGQGQKPNSQIILPESRGSLKLSMMEYACNPALWVLRQDPKFESRKKRKQNKDRKTSQFCLVFNIPPPPLLLFDTKFITK